VISNRGVGSRNEVSKLLKEGRVKVNGKVIRGSAVKISTNARIEIDNVLITEVSYIFMHINIITTSNNDDAHKTIRRVIWLLLLN
jgi:16S rRNA U516 pseudouridylate synthase RsuA-like enzyme